MELEIGKKYVANSAIVFKKLKGIVKTETNRRVLSPGEWFIPLSNYVKFTWFGINALEIFLVHEEN